MGPNGAGKTTLLEAILSADRKQILLDSKPCSMSNWKALTAQIGYIGHEPGLFLDLSAVDNLGYFSDLNDTRLKEEDLLAMLDRVGLQNRATDHARDFSRGMRQRLGLARATLHNPSLILMDEPLTGLDRDGVQVLQSLIQQEKKRGAIQILVTHSEEPFLELADRFLFLNRGRLIADIVREKYTDSARQRVHELLSDL
jgi:heme exporter protein A